MYKQKAGFVGSRERICTTVHALMNVWNQGIQLRIVIVHTGALEYLNNE